MSGMTWRGFMIRRKIQYRLHLGWELLHSLGYYFRMTLRGDDPQTSIAAASLPRIIFAEMELYSYDTIKS